MNETPVTFTCQQQTLLGILNQPSGAADVGVLLVVGDPQYRAGSHRQFTQLARALGDQGLTSLRFDYRGMGDSAGDKQAFDAICDDIGAAVECLIARSGVSRVVIWGLCDAASAAMIYAHKDPRVAGIVLLNPWLRSDQAMGKTMLKHYYLKRLLSGDFWRKLAGGGVRLGQSLADARGFAKDSLAQGDTASGSYQDRMRDGLARFKGQVCLILSGVDLTAKEFEEQTLGNKAWKLLASERTRLHRISKADHTFSSAQYKREVESVTAEFVKALAHQ